MRRSKRNRSVTRCHCPFSTQEAEAGSAFFGRMYRRAVQRFSYDLNVGLFLTGREAETLGIPP